MVKQENFLDAYQKSQEVLKLGLDLGNQAYSILPQMYLNCYQLCRKAQTGNDVEENEALEFYETGFAWATKLRGNNTVFSKLDPPKSHCNQEYFKNDIFSEMRAFASKIMKANK